MRTNYHYGILNRTLVKKELELITAEMLNKLEEARNYSYEELNKRIETAIGEIRKQSEIDKQESSKSYQDLLKTYSENQNQQINILKTSFDEKATTLTKQIERTERITDLNSDRIKTIVERETKLLKREILTLQAEMWIAKYIWSLALSSYIQLAHIDIEINYDWAFKYTYKDIIKCLEKLSRLSEDDSKNLNTLLEIAKEKNKAYVDEIKNVLKDKPVYKSGSLDFLATMFANK